MIPVEDLEVAVLDRTRTQPRKFRRLAPARLTPLLADRGPDRPAVRGERHADGPGGRAAVG